MALTIDDLPYNYTKSTPERMAGMIEALKHIDDNHIVGDVVECGVWRGGNVILARMMSPHRLCWLYDTYTGMTVPGKFDKKQSGAKAIDRYREGWSAVSLEEVREHFKKFGVLDDKYLHFIVGPVENTLLVPGNLPERIALLRLDTDWYESTHIELEVLYPKLVQGGVLIVDDYGHWMGSKKAVDEFLPGASFKKIDYSAVMMVK